MPLAFKPEEECDPEPPTEKMDVYTNFEYGFGRFGQYLISSLCYCISGISYVYFKHTLPNHPPIAMMLITSTFICLPVYYMQVFLGRYTQNSVFHLKHMVPIAKGLPYIQMSVTVLYTIGTGYDLTDMLLYLLMSFQKTLPWTVCPKNITETCFYHRVPPHCTECMHSAMAYWKYIYMDEPALTYSDLKFGLPLLHRFVTSCVSWLFIFLITGIAYKQRHKCLSIMFYIYLTTLAILFSVVLLNVGATSNLPYIFGVGSDNYLDPNLWAEAMIKSVKLLHLGQAHHVLAGARFHKNASVGLWCVAFWAVLMAITLLTTMFTMAVEGVQIHHTGTKTISVEHLHQVFVVLIPGGLTYTGAAHAWSGLFFFSLCALFMANIVTRIITLQLNVTNFKPVLQKFKVYMLVGYCLTFVFASTFLLSEDHYVVSRLILEDTTLFLEIVSTTLIIIVVFWIYGIQTISDDILFLTNHKPIRFWIITWYICPVVFILLVIYVTVKMLESRIYIVVLVSTAVLLIPLLACAVHQVYSYVKKQHLIGLIEPENEWGMPDSEGRHLRRMFNPRTETKFDSKRRTCNHKCILNSEYLRTICYYENLHRTNIIPDRLQQDDETLEHKDGVRNEEGDNEKKNF